jgi:hypothetical protein
VHCEGASVLDLYISDFTCRLVPTLIACGKSSSTLTNQVVSAQLINCIGTEEDESFLASLHKCFTDTFRIVGGPSTLSTEFHNGIIEATKRQLQSIADRQKHRAQRPIVDLEDLERGSSVDGKR